MTKNFIWVLLCLILSTTLFAETSTADEKYDDRKDVGLNKNSDSKDVDQKKLNIQKDQNDLSETTKSLVPPGFGETPRYKGGYNPINPSGAGAGY